MNVHIESFCVECGDKEELNADFEDDIGYGFPDISFHVCALCCEGKTKKEIENLLEIKTRVYLSYLERL